MSFALGKDVFFAFNKHHRKNLLPDAPPMDLRYNYIYVPWTTDGASNIGLARLCFDFVGSESICVVWKS